MAAFAGRYSENLQDRYGNGYRNAEVTVETPTGEPATLYADRVKTPYVSLPELASNVTKADSRGNLIFFADPGNYQIVVTPVGGPTLSAFPITVPKDPLEPVYGPGGTDVAVTDGGTGASTVEDAWTNLGIAFLLGMLFNVKDSRFGAIGDGVADDTEAIQATIDAAAAASLGNNRNAVAYFPHGMYNYSGLDWKRCNLLGNGPWTSRLIYSGAEGGTTITRSTTNNLYVRGLSFGGVEPSTWIDCYNDGAGDDITDYGDLFEDVYFSNCTGSALKTGTLTNLNLTRIRWEACEYAIEVIAGDGPLRVLDLDQFTLDFSNASNHKGLIKYVAFSSTCNVHARVANGRYEGSSPMQTTAALIHASSSPANNLNTHPVKALFENVAVQISGSQPSISVVHLESTQTNVLASVVSINSHFDGLTTWMSGAVRSGYTVPTFPGLGRVNFAAIGGVATGTSPALAVQIQSPNFDRFGLDGYADIGDVSVAPVAPAVGSLRFYGRLGALRWKNSSGTEFVIANTTQAQTFAAKQTFNTEVELDGALNHDGTTAGFFGAAPTTQPAANPDTSGATLGELEIEVNEMKATLRSLGLLAT